MSGRSDARKYRQPLHAKGLRGQGGGVQIAWRWKGGLPSIGMALGQPSLVFKLQLSQHPFLFRRRCPSVAHCSQSGKSVEDQHSQFCWIPC